MWFSDELPDELDELWPGPLGLSEVDAIRLDTVLAADFAVHRRRRLPYWSKPATVEPPPDDDDPEDFKPWPHDPGPPFGWAAEAPLALVCALVRSWEERLGARVVAGFGSALTERVGGEASLAFLVGLGPLAEPLLGAPCLVPPHLGEAQFRREAHRAGVGGLGAEDDGAAG